MPRRPPRPPRASHAWRRTAQRVRGLVEPGAVEQRVEDPAGGSETTHVLRVLTLAMDLSDILLSTGASANDVTLTVRKVTRAYGLLGVQADVTFTSISLSWHRRGREPLTTLRVVRARSVDYNRLQRAYDLSYGIESGRLDLDAAEQELRSVRRVQYPYRRWVTVGSSGALAVGVCALYAATPIVMLVAFVASCLVHLALGWLGSKNVPAFFGQAIGAAIPTTATLVVTWLQAREVPLFATVQPTLVVSSGIVLLLAGMSTVGAAQDSIDGYYVTASARAFEVMMLTLGIVAGLLAVLRFGKALGMSVLLGAAAPVLGPLPNQLLGAVIIAAAFAVGCNARPRTVVLCAGMGLIGWLAYLVALALTLGPVGASAASGLGSAIIGTTLGPRLKVPSLALVTAAIIALMPGSMVYRGILLMAEANASSDVVSGLMMLLSAGGVGLGLAAGTSLGSFLAQPIADRPRRTRRRG